LPIRLGDAALFGSSTGVATDLGGSVSGTGPVSMDDNGTQLVITNGTNGYLYSHARLYLITDVDFNAADTVQFFDQRFYFDWKNTNKFFGSDLLDGTSYNALVFASAETRPDNVKALVLNKQILLVFGDTTIEPWQDIGAANMPLGARARRCHRAGAWPRLGQPRKKTIRYFSSAMTAGSTGSTA
jgi:hypothetical protein